MSDGAAFGGRETISDEAIAWLVRTQSEQVSWEDWAALTEWLEVSPDHRDAFRRAEAVDGNIALRAPEIAAAIRRASVIAPRVARRRPPWAHSRAFAACAIAASAIFGTVIWRASEGASTTYRTQRGETLVVALTDGTEVTMNAASTMTVRIGWLRRRIHLGSAEAAFDVAKDSRRPFIVSVGDQQIRDVGTAFNIRHYGRSIVVTVAHGVVDVRQNGLGSVPVARLVRGESLSHTEGNPYSTRRNVDSADAYAWVHGRIVCDNRPLGSIVADLNRRYPTPIRVTAAAAALRFSGVLELGDEDTAVRRLTAYLGLPTVRTSSGIVIG